MSVQVKILYAIAVLAFASAILMLIVDPGWGRVLTLAGLVCAAAGMADNLPQLEKTFPQLYRAAQQRQWQPKRIDRLLTVLGAALLIWGLWLSASYR
jgi:hypothetical protein